MNRTTTENNTASSVVTETQAYQTLLHNGGQASRVGSGSSCYLINRKWVANCCCERFSGRSPIISHPYSRYSIFVVDDEYIIASSLAVILRGEGFDATPFSKPLDALHAVEIDTPDLLLSDVSMPVMSGVDLAIQVLKLSPGCRVLLFSGQAATADLLIAARADGYDFDFLSKPAHPKELLRTVHNVLDARNKRQQ